MKLNAGDRDDLRRALREHPDVRSHVTNLARIEKMPTRALLSLAAMLNVDAAAAIKSVQDREAERMQHSTKYPAFEGVLKFDLTVEVLGRRMTRKARAEYSYTPEWEYFDLRKNAVYKGWPGSGLKITVRIIPSKDGEFGGSGWEEIDILDIGEIWDVLDEQIEKRSKAEDAKRRRAVAKRRN